MRSCNDEEREFHMKMVVKTKKDDDATVYIDLAGRNQAMACDPAFQNQFMTGDHPCREACRNGDLADGQCAKCINCQCCPIEFNDLISIPCDLKGCQTTPPEPPNGDS